MNQENYHVELENGGILIIDACENGLDTSLYPLQDDYTEEDHLCVLESVKRVVDLFGVPQIGSYIHVDVPDGDIIFEVVQVNFGWPEKNCITIKLLT